MTFKLILTLVKPHLTDAVVTAMKNEGATGATIVPARGTGIHEAKSFFGLAIEDQTDIILFLIEEHMVDKLLGVIAKAGKFDEPSTGIAFVMPIEQAIGLDSQIQRFKEQAGGE